MEIATHGAARTAEDLFALLDAMGIEHGTRWHPPVFTVAESQALETRAPGGHTKNLFLRDRNGDHFLVTAEERARIDLKAIHARIGAKGRVSFGRPDRLMALLGVVPGAVSPLGLINDTNNEVRMVLDEALMRVDAIHAHPLRNDATTTIARGDFLHFLEETGHPPLIAALA